MHTMTVTEELDYALEVLLPEVIKDLFSISSEETKQCMLNLYLYQHFEAKVGRIKFFLFS